MHISALAKMTVPLPYGKKRAQLRPSHLAAAAGLILGIFLLFAPTARAADAYTSANVSMRAGPAVDYPRILVLNAGTPVTVYGCVADYSWCDTSFQDARGWVAGSYLTYPYQGNRVAIPAFGAQLGLSILSFSLDSYWDSYYRNRPWYRQRSYWDRHPPRPVFNRPNPGRPGYNRPPPRPRPPQTTLPQRPKPPTANRPPRPGNGDRPSRPNPGGNRPGIGNRPAPGQGQNKPAPRPKPTTRPAPSASPQSN